VEAEALHLPARKSNGKGNRKGSFALQSRAFGRGEGAMRLAVYGDGAKDGLENGLDTFSQ
jgi:hypothetical protein